LCAHTVFFSDFSFLLLSHLILMYIKKLASNQINQEINEKKVQLYAVYVVWTERKRSRECLEIILIKRNCKKYFSHERIDLIFFMRLERVSKIIFLKIIWLSYVSLSKLVVKKLIILKLFSFILWTKTKRKWFLKRKQSQLLML
jgi:hypothetical protein